MLSLSIVAACIIGCNYAVICPSGTSQVGGARTSGSAQCGAYSNIPDIGTCQTRCESSCGGNCQAFGYSERYDRCALYQSATPGPYGAPPDQILCSSAREPTTAAPIVPALQCPRGSTQVGGVPQSGLSPCSGPATRNSIEGCEYYCNADNPIGACCQSFSYSDATDECVAYRDTRPGSARPIYGGGSDQILCRPDLECPVGTSQIGGIGAYFQNAPQVYQAPYGRSRNIEECRDICDRISTCTAFAFDYDVMGEDVTPAVCRGYNANSGHAVGAYNGGYQADQILCAVMADFSAQSPGLFSVDGMVGYSNGNGQVYVQIPAYVVYGIVALILVNIVCLMVHCWNKSKGNSKDYKTVSMRSDIEEETDIN